MGVFYSGSDAGRRLADLGVTAGDLQFALAAAVADVRTCTELDAPGAPGYLFWSRCNRYLRERLIPKEWFPGSKDHILRIIEPSARFAITAVSGAGGVGKEGVPVRAKNPKGPAMAKLVERNGQLALFGIESLRGGAEGREIDDLSTWYLLYRSDENGLAAELSLPVKMSGKWVDTWEERIFFQMPPIDGPGFDLSKLDEPDDGEGPDFPVELVGGL